jgi:calcineurin-like phosphoesterase family protein
MKDDSNMRMFVTTDTHFGHRAMVEKLRVRDPEYEETIIRNWTSMVSKEDMVIHLGDLFLASVDIWHKLAGQLPGRKILVLGNHDRKPISWYLRNGFDFCCNTFVWRMYGLKILFSHAPVLEGGFDLNIHGHLHGNTHHDIECDNRHYAFALEETGYQPRLLKTLVDDWMKDNRISQ